MTNHYGLTDEHSENLAMLATYLEKLPEDYKHFEMRDFIRHKRHWDPSVVHYVLNNGGLYENCGSVGCALGHGPASGVLARLGLDVDWDLDGNKRMNWDRYASRFVPPGEDGRVFTRLWQFLFAPDWSDTDNTHRGAAARIRFILSGRPIPEGFTHHSLDAMKAAMEAYQQFIKVGE